MLYYQCFVLDVNNVWHIGEQICPIDIEALQLCMHPYTFGMNGNARNFLHAKVSICVYQCHGRYMLKCD